MNLLEFFGLNEDPFRLSPDPVYFFPSTNHMEALNGIEYVVDHREGFCLITGEPGTGKTTLLRIFIEKWKERADIALILTPRLRPYEFLVSILDDLKVNCPDKKGMDILKMWRAFRDFLIERSKEGRPVIVITDESQDLSCEVLEELRLLTNLETDKGKLLQVILVGQPEIEEKLAHNNLIQLDQRITVRVRLQPLNEKEIIEYLNYRLVRAGKGFIELDSKVIKRIYEVSKGIPRIINLVASRSLMAAYVEGVNRVVPRHVSYAIEHLRREEVDEKMSKHRSFTLRAKVALIVLLILFAGFALRYGSYPYNGVYLKSGLDRFLEIAMTYVRPYISGNDGRLTVKRVKIPIDAADKALGVSAAYNTTGLGPGNEFPLVDHEGEDIPDNKKGEYPVESFSMGLKVETEKGVDKEYGATLSAETKTIGYPATYRGAKEKGRYGLVKTFAANIRARPSLRAMKIGLVYKGDKVPLLEETSDNEGRKWYRLEIADNREGWLSGKVIEIPNE